LNAVEQLAFKPVIVEPELSVRQALTRHLDGGKRAAWNCLVRHAACPPIGANSQTSRAT
jgi:hypothetical protein